MEFVVHAQPTGNIRGRAGLGRAAAVLDRVGERQGDRRTMDATFELLQALQGREPVAKVTAHVCLHNEGVNDCRSAVIES